MGLIDVYYSIRNFLLYRQPRQVSIAKMRRLLESDGSVQEMKDALTQAMLMQVGLSLYGRPIGNAYLTPEQKKVKSKVEKFNYSVTLG